MLMSKRKLQPLLKKVSEKSSKDYCWPSKKLNKSKNSTNCLVRRRRRLKNSTLSQLTSRQSMISGSCNQTNTSNKNLVVSTTSINTNKICTTSTSRKCRKLRKMPNKRSSQPKIGSTTKKTLFTTCKTTIKTMQATTRLTQTSSMSWTTLINSGTSWSINT